MIRVRINTNNFRAGIKAGLHNDLTRTERLLENALQASGADIINWLRELTNNRTNDGRIKHHGGWADKTGQLSNAYGFHVEKINSGIRLTIENSAEYAIYLDIRDGFFVLKNVLGSTDDHGFTIIKKWLTSDSLEIK